MNERTIFTEKHIVGTLDPMNDGNNEDPISQAYPTGEQTNPNKTSRRDFLKFLGESALAAAAMSTIPGTLNKEKVTDFYKSDSTTEPATQIPEESEGEKESFLEPFRKASSEMLEIGESSFWKEYSDALESEDGRFSEDRYVEVFPSLNYKSGYYDRRELGFVQKVGEQRKFLMSIGIYEPENTDPSNKSNNAVQSSSVQIYLDLKKLMDNGGEEPFIMDAARKVAVINELTKPKGLRDLNWSMVDDQKMERQYQDTETGITYFQTLYPDGILNYDLVYPQNDSSNHYFEPQRRDPFPPKPKSV